MLPDLDLVLAARASTLPDGLQVLRALPRARRRMVGPFVFLDQMGPVDFAPGAGLDVGRHPHIGLATVTWLFEGEILHRDSLGTVQRITPGAVNWMTAGRGIAHSERATPDALAAGGRVHGIQIWVALPEEHEEAAPAFAHYPAHSLPQVDDGGVRFRVVAGGWRGAISPVQTHSPLFYAVAEAAPGASLHVPPAYEERALYVVEGGLELGGGVIGPGELAVLRPGSEPRLRAREATRVLLFGGEPLGPRYIEWNFVSSSRERIEQAKADWRAQAFGAIEGEPDFLPLPGDPKAPVDYP